MRSSRVSPRLRPPRIPIVCLALVVAALAGALVLSSCGSPATEVPPPPRQTATAAVVSQAEAQAALDGAAGALRAQDRAAFRAAVPAAPPAVRRSLDQFFVRLAGLPWDRFRFVVTPVPGHAGRFKVEAVGRLAGTGPDDRLAGVRLVSLERRDGIVTATADATPRAARGQYLMAFRDPVVVHGVGVAVIGDRAQLRRARSLAAAGREARVRLRRLRLSGTDRVLVHVYASRRQMRAALIDGPREPRISFFSGPAPRRSLQPWRLNDVGVLGPELDGTGAWLPLMLAHELTHAYTAHWFDRSPHAPPLLLEGLAAAVEGGRDFAPLRREVGSGNEVWPLPDALAVGDLWAGRSTDQVQLAYLEGESLVRYVLSAWGRSRLKPFLVAIADSDLSRRGLNEVCRRVLDVSWSEFVAGWKTYVLTDLRASPR